MSWWLWTIPLWLKLHQQRRGTRSWSLFVLSCNHTQHLQPCQIYPRQDECDCGRPLQGPTDPPHGVVSPSGHCPSHIQPKGLSQPRPHCQEVQHQVSNLRVTCAGQQGARHRHPSNEPMPSSSPDLDTGPQEIQPDEVLYPHSGRPKLSWFPDLLNLSKDEPMPLPVWEKMLKQPRSSMYHQNPRMLNLHAWRLSSLP